MPAPLAVVKSKFESKDKLVDQVVDLLAKDGEESKEDLRKRLAPASNKKLLRLHEVATQVKAIGGREKLISATASAEGKGKDKPYVAKLENVSSASLLDKKKSAERRSKKA